jgi:hypothetical protein
LVDVAPLITAWRTSLAGGFEHDGFVGFGVIEPSEEDESGFEEAFCTIAPDLLRFACGLGNSQLVGIE